MNLLKSLIVIMLSLVGLNAVASKIDPIIKDTVKLDLSKSQDIKASANRRICDKK